MPRLLFMYLFKRIGLSMLVVQLALSVPVVLSYLLYQLPPAAVRGGLLSLEEACERYVLTVEEYLSWQRSIDRHGLAGLRTTRIQQYRQ